MKITKEWLKKQNACESGIELYNEIGKTDVIEIIDSLIKKKKDSEARWLIKSAIGEKRMTQYLRLFGVKMIDHDGASAWATKTGFTHLKQTGYFGHYFKCDSDEFANMIKWHYDDSSDCHYVKWQSWWGNNKDSPERAKRWPVPDKDVYLEAETETHKFTGYYDSGFNKMMTYIKKNNNKMIKACKDHIKKRLNKLQS